MAAPVTREFNLAMSKRRKSKPTRFADFLTDVQEENPSPKINIVVSDANATGQVQNSSRIKTKKNKLPESVQKAVKKPRKSTSSRSVPPTGQLIEHLENGHEEVGLEVLECSRPSKPLFSFQEVKSFEDFRILVNGDSIDRMLPDDDRMGYFKLCSYKKEFLHPAEGLNGTLVAGMICETVRIGNEIKMCKPTTTKEKFENWETNLTAFERLGMKVEFLRDKIPTLARLVFESEGASDINQYMEATVEHKHIKDELKKVAAKQKELKESAKKIEGKVGILKAKVEKYEHEFKEVDAPW